MGNLLLIGLALGLFAVQGLGAGPVIVFGDDSYPPVISLAAGHPSGILVRILDWVSRRTGDPFTLELVPWKRAYTSALTGSGGIIGLSWTRDRDSVFDFSDTLYQDDIQVIMRAGKEFPFRTLADLKGKRVGGELGASFGNGVDEAVAQGMFTVDRDTSEVSRLKKLLDGKLDAAFIGNGTVGFHSVLAADPELTAHQDQFVVAPRPLVIDGLHLAFLKSMGQKALLERFNRALALLQQSSEWTAITK